MEENYRKLSLAVYICLEFKSFLSRYFGTHSYAKKQFPNDAVRRVDRSLIIPGPRRPNLVRDVLRIRGRVVLVPDFYICPSCLCLSIYLSLLSRSIFDHHLRCGGWLNLEFSKRVKHSGWAIKTIYKK